MQKLCPVCQTINDAVGFDLTEKEMFNLKQLGLSEHLCKCCYNKELSTLATATKAKLIPLNKKKESTQAAYYEAYEAWKSEAELYKAIDYNLNFRKFDIKKKESPIKKIPTSKEPINVEVLAKQILAKLSEEQQQAIINTFRAAQTISQ